MVATSPAIFFDASPNVGERSVALCRALGVDLDPRKGGTDARCVQFNVFASNGTSRPLTLAEIEARVKGRLATPVVG